MPSPVLRAPGDGPTALWLDAQGRLVSPCTELPCEPCGAPVPGLWVRGSLCACSSSGEAEAWMRATDLAQLRADNPGGTCPTGRLPDGSCWEVLAGAETREFDEPGPPAGRRLTPHGVGGCCVCCPGCTKRTLGYRTRSTCAAPVARPTEACCQDGDEIVSTGYAERSEYKATAGGIQTCGAAGEAVLDYRQAWWTCDGAGCRGVMRRREWTPTSAGCRLDRDQVYESADSRVTDRCDALYVYPDILSTGLRWEVMTAAAAATGDMPDGLGISCFPARCTPHQLGLAETPTLVRWDYVLYPTAGTPNPCVRNERRTGFVIRQPAPAGTACRGRCAVGVLAPMIPPPPGGGNSVGGFGFTQTRGGILVPDSTLVADASAAHTPPRSGCAGCGGDGGL